MLPGGTALGAHAIDVEAKHLIPSGVERKGSTHRETGIVEVRRSLKIERLERWSFPRLAGSPNCHF